MKTILPVLLLISTVSIAQVEPDAGKWKTWVIKVDGNYRLPKPPEAKETEKELEQLSVLQKQEGTSLMDEIAHWNGGAPGYRWGQLTSEIADKKTPPFRSLALLHIAIYDATIAAWNNKYYYKRARPNASFVKAADIPVPASPSFPCENSAATGAASVILSYLYPNKADSIQKIAQSALKARLLSGFQFPSDVSAGFELGKKVGEEVVAWARQDRSDLKSQDSIPKKPGLWTGTNPVGATVGKWKTWTLDSANQFRPGPPPDFAKDMQELKSFKPTIQAKARAFFYAPRDIWSEITDKKIFEYGLQNNPPKAAKVYALKSIAGYDAYVACWDAKYNYLGIRPYQYDTTYVQLLNQPPFPGYPSGHATVSSSMATVLSKLFPSDALYFEKTAQECAESRFEGGIHFRTDNEVGLVLGNKVGKTVLLRAGENSGK